MDDDQKAQEAEAKQREWIEARLPGWKRHVEYIRKQSPAFAERGFESIKHMTTLSAGSVVLIATFMNDIFPREMTPITKGLIAASFLSFGLALIYSVFYINRYVNALVRVFVPSTTETLDPDVPRPKTPELEAVLIEVNRFGEDTQTLAKTWYPLKRAYLWTSVGFTSGILTFGTAILENVFFG